VIRVFQIPEALYRGRGLCFAALNGGIVTGVIYMQELLVLDPCSRWFELQALASIGDPIAGRAIILELFTATNEEDAAFIGLPVSVLRHPLSQVVCFAPN